MGKPTRRQFLQYALGTAGLAMVGCSKKTDSNKSSTKEPTIICEMFDIDSKLQTRFLEEIISEHPQVIAFGENHPPEGYTGRDSFGEFMRLLPRLSELGYKELVLEGFPYDLKSWNMYMEPSSIDVNRYLSIFERLPISNPLMVQVLAKKYGVNIHGVSPLKEGNISDTAQLIDNKSKEKVKQLISEGKKVLAYNGRLHVLCRGDTQFGCPSYGKELFSRIGNKYLEVQLFIPEIRELRDPGEFDLFPDLPDSNYFSKRYLYVREKVPDSLNRIRLYFKKQEK